VPYTEASASSRPAARTAALWCVSMHFLVLVLGPDVERQLALYGTRTKLSAYRHYVPSEEIEHSRAVFRRDRTYGVDPDDLSAVIAWLAGDDLGGSIGQDEQGWYYWSTYNWKSRWDSWTVGGGWERALISRPGGAVVHPDASRYTGSPDPERAEQWNRAAPGERVRGAQALKGDIDFEAMQREALAQAAKTWDEWEASRHTERPDELLAKQVGGFTREQHLARSSWCSGYLVVDGLWHERGDLGLRVDVTDERVAEWSASVTDQLDRLPADALITCVDCHS
jgi:hypothetical protein